jgi:hypothetical protein
MKASAKRIVARRPEGPAGLRLERIVVSSRLLLWSVETLPPSEGEGVFIAAAA